MTTKWTKSGSDTWHLSGIAGNTPASPRHRTYQHSPEATEALRKLFGDALTRIYTTEAVSFDAGDVTHFGEVVAEFTAPDGAVSTVLLHAGGRHGIAKVCDASNQLGLVKGVAGALAGVTGV